MEKFKILLADDVDLFLELERSYFDPERFQVLLARDGEEAFEKAVMEKPDMIFLDLFMPEMNGDECCQIIKSMPSLAARPVIMVTKAGPDHYERCRQAGCDEIVSKPITKTAFLEMVKKHLKIDLDDRASQRVEARFHVRFGAGPGNMLIDYSVNISDGGLFIETGHILPEDTRLTLELFHPLFDEPVVCQGRVAWVNAPGGMTARKLPSGMGIQFLDLTLEDMWAIREIIRESQLRTRGFGRSGECEPTWAAA